MAKIRAVERLVRSAISSLRVAITAGARIGSLPQIALGCAQSIHL
jgi:hypothetical protein